MTEQPILSPAQLRDAYRQVTDRIAEVAQRCGRRPGDILTVAVTKTATPDQIRAIVDLGHADLGENRVQHLAQRVAQLDEYLGRKKTLAGAAPRSDTQPPEKVRWHMIGHLQRNKVKQVVPLVHLVHSVDSLRLAEEIHNFAARSEQVVDVLIQVNTARDENKHGIAPPAVIHLAEQIHTMLHLRLRGLMAMAPYGDDPEQARPTFARTAEIFADLRKQSFSGPECNILSMGMSHDFEIAIEEGANLLRIGRAFFGDPQS